MNGASASTVVARIRIRPNKQRKTASGNIQRLLESLRHNPRARSAIDPPALPSMMSRRRIWPCFLIMQLPHSAAGRLLGLLGDQRRPGDEHVDPAAAER